jgi:hypothetical protein
LNAEWSSGILQNWILMWKPFTWHEEITNDVTILRVDASCGDVRLLLTESLNLVNSLLETQTTHYFFYFMLFQKLINTLLGHFSDAASTSFC